MTAAAKIQLKVKIKDLIAEAEAAIVSMEAMTRPVAPENSIGRISRMDAINNKSVMESSLRNTKSRLSKLRVAWHTIDDPDFGVCSMCKQIIQEGRLLYMPESTRCVRCASRR